MLQVHNKQPVASGNQLDLTLLRLGCVHIVPLADLPQDICGIIFVEHCLIIFPDVQMILAHAEQHRDILFSDNMPFPKHRIFGYARNNLGDVMAEDLPDGIPGSD